MFDVLSFLIKNNFLFCMKFSRYIRAASIACTKREGYRVENSFS
ncbi:hypothetical protein ANACAC_01117 [Anaerostipes caccae L1-92]|uniref:Uncharacterized protein n=1 Tax=Anaerostipes caccae (strain DSM 14662 / CCUG 47493 / JCM 13470 / NCIMB 13811 / L1-92) TaxID=411490 RepID=B0MC27_ANACD|nr:hypothetical protein ANACAC_01117 [Anaerostipes caccae L1-92]